MPKKLQNKREDFTEKHALRLQNVQIECCDAAYLIRARDADGALFYCAPPYCQANMGHYGGYTAQDFEDLLLTLSGKIKFLLSSYPSACWRSMLGRTIDTAWSWRTTYLLQRTKPHSKKQKQRY